jgi:hypothetical protein
MDHIARVRGAVAPSSILDPVMAIRSVLFALATVLALIGLIWSSGATGQSLPAATASLIVKFVPGLTPSEQAAMIARNGGVEISSVPALRLHTVQVDSTQLATITDSYRADPQVVRVEVNKVRQSDAVPSDPLYVQQWALPRIGWDQVFGVAVPIGTATVAVLDTGIDATHPDLAGNTVPGTSILTGSDGRSDPNGHGTMVAGIVAARTNTSPPNGIAGVGYSAVRLMPVTVLDAGGLGQDSDVIAGVVWAADHGADVILMAFSNPGFSESLQEAIDYAWSNNVVLVAAVGNDGLNSTSFPAGDRSVIGVSATDENDQLTSFSNYGASVFIAAPGTNIVSTELGGSYSASSGTSTSAAIVAGAAAQLMAFDPLLSNGVIVGRLARTADPAGTQTETGNGRINFARAFADTGTDSVQPNGAGPVGSGGPFVGPYVAAARNLNLTFAGTGTGTVKITPSTGTVNAPVSCGGTGAAAASQTVTGTCSPNITTSDNGATVTFLATANGGSAFGGWSAAANLSPSTCSGTTNPCSAILGGGPALTVTFTGNAAPFANGQSVSTDEDVAKVISLSATDADGNSLTFSVVASPTHGTLSAIGAPVCSGTPSTCTASVTYTPAANYNGPDSFTFKANDGSVDSSDATVSIAVNPVNDAPSAAAQSVSTLEDSAVAITLSGSDLETAPANLVYTVTAAPAHGTLSGSGRNLTYTPNADYNGPDSFQFKVTDRGDPDNCTPGPTCAGALQSSAATVSITVTPVNDPPTANAQSVTTAEDTATAVTLSGSDLETASGNLTFTVTVNPAHGTLSGTAPNLTYTPAPNYNGPDSFQFTVTDRGDPDNCGAPSTTCTAALQSAAATVSITVTPVNDAPTANPQTLGTSEDTPLSITLTGTDVETSSADLTFTITLNPAHGTLTGTPPNLLYTPNANYSGADSFQFRVTDRGDPDNCAPGPACSAALQSLAATITIAVSPVNDAPVANAQSVSTQEDTPLGIVLTGTDLETSAANLTFTVTVSPVHGVLSGTAPNLTYTPAANYNGTDSFQFTVTDRGDPDNCGAASSTCAASIQSSPATIAITVTPVNDAPAALAQNVSSAEDAPLAITLSGTDVETAAGNLVYTVTSFPLHGTLSGTGRNLTYTPAGNYNGPDSFQFKVTDRGDPDGCSPGPGCSAALASTAATISIMVTPLNDPPTAIAQSVSTPEDTQVSITLDGSDTETATADLAFVVTVPPAHGALSGTAPNLTYTPDPNYNGPDSFEFTVTDRGDPDNCGVPGVACAGALTSTPALVSIVVTPVNDVPTAAPQTLNTLEDTNLTVTLTGTDVETATANLAFTVTANPLHGTLSGTAPNLTYIPNANYNGPDAFQFTITDRGDPDNCGPVGIACAAASTSGPATISITVTPVNDPPIANAQSSSLAEDASVSILLTGSDVETSPAALTYTVTAPPAHGTLSGSGSTLTYTPQANYNGPDSFQFTVTDRGDPDSCAPGPACAPALTSAPATVSIIVSPVNDAPTASAKSVTTAEDTPVAIQLDGVDVETSPANLVYIVVSPPLNGTLTGSGRNLTYTPNANFNGSDSFQFKVTDRGDPDDCTPVGIACSAALTSTQATVSITVTPVNDPPSAFAQNVSTFEDTPLSITLAGADAETLTGLSFAITSLPAHGVLSGTAPNLTYTPAANYNGLDSFQFTVTDAGDPDNCGTPSATCSAKLTSAPATVSITIRPINDAPVANAQGTSTQEDTAVMIVLTGSDVETAGANLTFTITVPPLHGTLSGTLPVPTYTPDPNYNGSDSFQFTVTDRGDPDNCGAVSAGCTAAIVSVQATVSITVSPVNDPPANVSISVSPSAINENDSVSVSGSFTDADIVDADQGGAHTVVIEWGDGSQSTLTVPAGQLMFSATHQYLDDKPTATSSDVNTINATVTDTGGASSSGSTTVTVNNLPPAITGVSGPPDPVPVGSTVTIGATFTDVGTLDTHTCVFSWGDGSPDTTVTAAGMGSGSCSDTHKYTVSNVYEPTVTVRDDDKGSATSSFEFVVVYDANNGFVTGGGWITSPAGALAARPAQTGKATFGFVSKYLKGSTVPTGNTEFDFHAGDFNFKSTSYEWLVISGSKARYHGFGKINGAGNFEFELTAWDGKLSGGGGLDKLRLQVWDQNQGNAMIYDNQIGAPAGADPTTVLGGGSITIHK